MLQNYCSSDGIRIDHTGGEVDTLLSFIYEKDLYGFVELEIHEGGLALCIMREIPKLHYLGIASSYDMVSDATRLKAEKHRYTEILVGDTISSEIVTQVTNWMNDRWPVLIYCDGSNKQAQIMMYKNLVRYGDFIGIHDYWNKSRIIPEIQNYPYGELKPEILDTDLKHMKHEFQLVRFESLINTRIAILTRRTK